MKKNQMIKIAAVAAVVLSGAGCEALLGTGTSTSGINVKNKTSDDGAATVTTGSGSSSSRTVTFMDDIVPILTKARNVNAVDTSSYPQWKGVSCINCHVAVLNTANVNGTSKSVSPVSGNFVMAVLNPSVTVGSVDATWSSTTGNFNGTTGNMKVGSSKPSDVPADPALLAAAITTTGGVVGRIGWNCDGEDYKIGKYNSASAGNAESAYGIRHYAISKIAVSGKTSVNHGSRLLEKVGGANYGLGTVGISSQNGNSGPSAPSAGQRMPLNSSTTEIPSGNWTDWLSAAEIDTIEAWVLNGAPCE